MISQTTHNLHYHSAPWGEDNFLYDGTCKCELKWCSWEETEIWVCLLIESGNISHLNIYLQPPLLRGSRVSWENCIYKWDSSIYNVIWRNEAETASKVQQCHKGEMILRKDSFGMGVLSTICRELPEVSLDGEVSVENTDTCSSSKSCCRTSFIDIVKERNTFYFHLQLTWK